MPVTAALRSELIYYIMNLSAPSLYRQLQSANSLISLTACSYSSIFMKFIDRHTQSMFISQIITVYNTNNMGSTVTD